MATSLEFDRKIAGVAARAWGVVTQADIDAAAGTAKMVRARVLSGRWQVMAPQVWRIAVVPECWEQSLHAGLRWLGDGALISGLAAAGLHSFDGFGPGPVEFLLARSGRWRHGPYVVHTTTRLERIDRAMARSFPVTSAARTIIDLAGRKAVTGRQLASAIDSATRDGLISTAALAKRISKLRPMLPRGIRRLDELMLDAGGHSHLERRFLRLMRLNDLPRPMTQVVYRRDGTTVARVDFDYGRPNLIVEVSGRLGHVSDADRQKDARRRNELQRQGKRVVEFTTADVLDDPGYVARTMREQLRA